MDLVKRRLFKKRVRQHPSHFSVFLLHKRSMALFNMNSFLLFRLFEFIYCYANVEFKLLPLVAAIHFAYYSNRFDE